MLLEVKDLEVHYGQVYALKGVSLEAEKASIVTLVGANGAGKSTLLRAISGLVPSTSGDILLRNERINKLKPHTIVGRGITHIPEGRRIFGPMTVLENLEMGAYLRRDKRGIARDMDEIYSRFPILEERRNQRSESLSGGEQQMLAIARALIGRPDVILMDEPSLGLSPLMVDQVADITGNIRQSGVTIVLVEQNARMALELADTAYVLEVGMVAIYGKAKELVRDRRVQKAYLGG